MLAMSSNSTTLLGLRLLPRPSIRAEPGPVVARGRPVTILCRGPAGAHTFRLESKKNTSAFMDQKNIPQRGSLETEARFLIPAVSEVTAGPYRCAYIKRFSWSERSEVLELKLTDEDVPVLPSGAPREVSPLSTEAGSQTAPASRNYTVENCIRISLAVVVLLILVAILAEAGHSQCRSPHGTQEGAHQKD
ncbi:PREDICTED: leukocyte-associated immunoglobulin-like receptor 2 isoform X2 [Hipposideros armiger]|uniref:Leukocyte-associated immunoglobulin-like receptor 2 isoform X2 n=1 Tax=Hipposideros armiger TaxID=186990 RepID=A0A8B7Q094_HIPAR|nr:PREDICTED: leukocyte-associated immunoglobulin-like receptor 2 isoform X2 [Hipposideros armiger]